MQQKETKKSKDGQENNDIGTHTGDFAQRKKFKEKQQWTLIPRNR